MNMRACRATSKNLELACSWLVHVNHCLHLKQCLFKKMTKTTRPVMLLTSSDIEDTGISLHSVTYSNSIRDDFSESPVIKIRVSKVTGAHPPRLGTDIERMSKQCGRIFAICNLHGETKQMAINAISFRCFSNILYMARDGFVKKGYLFCPRLTILCVLSGTRAHCLDKRRAGRRNRPCSLRPPMQKGTHLRGFISTALFPPKSSCRELNSHLYVRIGTKTGLFDVIAAIPLETLHIQFVISDKLVEV
mmetsp:Transcript_3719/g.7230  ORF Transcript_3719/g.7230 Transcript_3719/m.7230 type:complete len:248 (+) Transcript_3719:77-820(+)